MSNIVNLAIGIGGSGAKSLEALVHLCGCGLGPKRLQVAIVDPDEANGNARRTRDAIKAYVLARAALNRSVTGNSKPATDCGLVATEIIDAKSWTPLPSRAKHLRELFDWESMSPDEQSLMDALYLAQDEQQMPLGEGFRGRPNVGAAALAALPAEAESFWSDLLETVSDVQQGSEVRIFLVGSIFGGTGASGFPVVARMLRRFVKEKGLERFRLSGAMLLPYFTFKLPDETADVVSADPRLFIAKAQQSLLFYQGLMDEGTFDDLYIVGWPSMIRLDGDPKHGGNDQCNPPLLPELYAAFAAADAFAAPLAEKEGRAGRQGEEEQTGGIHYIAVGSNRNLSWSDLPPVGAVDAKSALGKALRFAYAYARVYHQYLKVDKITQVSRQRFWRNYLRIVKLQNEDEQRAIDTIAGYCESLIRYFLTITDGSLAGGLDVRLFEKINLVSGVMTDGLLQLQDRTADSDLGGFPRLVVDSRGLDLTQILHALSERPRAGSEHGEGLGRFVSALHRYCAVAG